MEGHTSESIWAVQIGFDGCKINKIRKAECKVRCVWKKGVYVGGVEGKGKYDQNTSYKVLKE